MSIPARVPSAEGLAGKRALVTGGTKGIGAAVAARLREGGAAVLVTARNNADGASPEMFVAADLATSKGCTEIAKVAIDRLGGIDIVVNVAGGSSAPAGGFAVLDDAEWQRALDLNLLAAVRLERAATNDADAGLRSHRPHHLDPGADAATRRHHRL